MKTVLSIIVVACVTIHNSGAQEKNSWNDRVQIVLDNAEPLTFPRGNRLPLYLWPAIDPGSFDEGTAETLVRELNERGVGLVCSWNMGNKEAALKQGLTVARAQKKLGLMVNINATSLLAILLRFHQDSHFSKSSGS